MTDKAKVWGEGAAGDAYDHLLSSPADAAQQASAALERYGSLRRPSDTGVPVGAAAIDVHLEIERVDNGWLVKLGDLRAGVRIPDKTFIAETRELAVVIACRELAAMARTKG